MSSSCRRRLAQGRPLRADTNLLQDIITLTLLTLRRIDLICNADLFLDLAPNYFANSVNAKQLAI